MDAPNSQRSEGLPGQNQAPSVAMWQSSLSQGLRGWNQSSFPPRLAMLPVHPTLSLVSSPNRGLGQNPSQMYQLEQLALSQGSDGGNSAPSPLPTTMQPMPTSLGSHGRNLAPPPLPTTMQPMPTSVVRPLPSSLVSATSSPYLGAAGITSQAHHLAHPTCSQKRRHLCWSAPLESRQQQLFIREGSSGIAKTVSVPTLMNKTVTKKDEPVDTGALVKWGQRGISFSDNHHQEVKYHTLPARRFTTSNQRKATLAKNALLYTKQNGGNYQGSTSSQPNHDEVYRPTIDFSLSAWNTGSSSSLEYVNNQSSLPPAYCMKDLISDDSTEMLNWGSIEQLGSELGNLGDLPRLQNQEIEMSTVQLNDLVSLGENSADNQEFLSWFDYFDFKEAENEVTLLPTPKRRCTTELHSKAKERENVEHENTPPSYEISSSHVALPVNNDASEVSRPAPTPPKVPDFILKKFEETITELEQKVNQEGPDLFPLLADTWRRSENSWYMINLTGIHILEFKKIRQRINTRGYKKMVDFVADVRDMLDAIVEQFKFSTEIKTEVDKLKTVFIAILRSKFPDIDILSH